MSQYRVFEQEGVMLLARNMNDVEPLYRQKRKGTYYLRDNAILSDFRNSGYVPIGVTIFTISAVHDHNEASLPPKERMLAISRSDRAAKVEAVKPEAAPKALDPLAALEVLPNVEPGKPRTSEQNNEFHGIIAAIAKAKNKAPSDVKSLIVKMRFGEIVHTKGLNYEQMQGLIDFTRGIADSMGVTE